MMQLCKGKTLKINRVDETWRNGSGIKCNCAKCKLMH